MLNIDDARLLIAGNRVLQVLNREFSWLGYMDEHERAIEDPKGKRLSIDWSGDVIRYRTSGHIFYFAPKKLKYCPLTG